METSESITHVMRARYLVAVAAEQAVDAEQQEVYEKALDALDAGDDPTAVFALLALWKPGELFY